ncbi:MAG TPA: prepilin-type N-terminal cleavage/methylation domain-containing protein [Bacilli bacterium]|nr:prepilin-type N-terminal cleavage/methylation domain-containing protein [Bacilli bacterium]
MINKKGLTLVELLAVIILLGLISAAIAVPIVSLIGKNSAKLNEATLKTLYSTTELYMEKYSNTYKKIDGNIYYITMEQLIENDFLDKDYLNAFNDKTLSKNTQIKVTVNSGEYAYEISTNQINNIKNKYDSLDISSTYNYNDGTYIMGTNENNYVQYNGFIWRIMGVNSDGTIRLVMDELATSLIYSDSIGYDQSYVREWLNNYFVSRLKFNDIIKKESWYYNAPASASNTTIDKTISVKDSVGLISVEEFNLSLVSSTSYLKGQPYGLLNQRGTYFYTTVNSSKVPASSNITTAIFVKPVINIFASTVVVDGTGTSSSPFILNESNSVNANRSLKAANIAVGSYIRMDSKLYRVVNKESDRLKLISYDYLGVNAIYASTIFNTTNGVGKTLSTATLSNKFLNDNVFVGDPYIAGSNYKNTVFKKKNIVSNVKASVPVLGEIMTTSMYPASRHTGCYWAINNCSNSTAYAICSTSASVSSISTSLPIIYTGYISTTNVISSGVGTATSPYQI